MAQAAALLDGRSYVVPDDVKELAHRGAPAPDRRGAGARARGDHRRRGPPRDHREDRGATVIVVPSRRWLVGAAVLALVAPLALVWPAAAGLLPALDLAWLAAFLLRRGPRPGAAHARDRRARRRSRSPWAARPWCGTAGATAVAAHSRSRFASGCRIRSAGPSRRRARSGCRRARGSTSRWSSRPFAAGRVRAARSPSGHVARSASRGGRRRCRCPGRSRCTRACPTPPLRALPLQVASPARGRPPRDSAAGRRPVVRGPPRVGAGRRDPDHRLEGDRPAGQAHRAAVRGRAAAAGADRDRRRPAAHGRGAGRAPARGGDLRRPAARAGRGGARRQRRA